MPTFRCIACLLAGFAATPAAAREWFVSPAGSDATGNGSDAAPFRTFGHLLEPANALVQAGDVVTARGGRYEECEVRLRLPLTVRSYPGETAHIACALPPPVGCDEQAGDTVAVQIDPQASGSRLARLEISGGALYAVFLQTDWEQGSHEAGHGPADVVIEDCHIHDSGRDLIKITPHTQRGVIRRNHLHHSGRIHRPGLPLDCRNAEGIDNVNGSGMVVEDNHIHHTSTNGLYFKGGASDVVVQRNRIEYAGEGGILIGYDTSPDYFDLGVNPGYYEAIRGVVRNNLVMHTAYDGIGLYASLDAVVANNTIVDAGAEGHAALYFGVSFQDWDAAALRPANANPLIRNNLIVQDGARCVEIRYSEELGGLSGLAGATGSDYNAFRDDAGACAFFDARPGSPLGEGGDLAQWRGHGGGDAHSFEAALPLSADGHLLVGNPTIDAGQTLPQVVDDLDRQPRRGANDIGADEFAGDALFADGFER